jgi:hypothetical protein
MEKGKDFTSASKDDNVYTPYSMTRQLLEVENFDYNHSVLEPCSGSGAIVKVLKENFKGKIIYSDINLPDKVGLDFLEDEYEEFAYVISNPPYSKIDAFIAKTKKIAYNKFAFLCKVTHLGGVSRYLNNTFLDKDYPLTKIYMFTRQSNLRFNDKEKKLKELYKRLNYDNVSALSIEKKINTIKTEFHYPCLREDGKYPAGMYYYVWLVWENLKYRDPYSKYGIQAPLFQWINNDDFILRKNNKKTCTKNKENVT